MNDADRYRLLHGPYRPPALRRGDRASCLFRDATAIVTHLPQARIPRPRCRPSGRHGASGSRG